MATTISPLAWLAIGLIYLYKYCISPLIGARCRFSPTCSTYALEALKRYGFVKGVWLSSKRLLKCHPLNDGGYDPVPFDHKHLKHKQTKNRDN